MLFTVYIFAVRAWMGHWGAAREEVSLPLPSDELVLNPPDMRTRALTIQASAAEVFPWVVQLGWERAMPLASKSA